MLWTMQWLREFCEGYGTQVWAKSVGCSLQIQLLYEALGFLQQTRQETVYIFALMAVKALVQSFVKDLVEKSAASLP